MRSGSGLKIVPKLVFASVLLAMMISAAYAPETSVPQLSLNPTCGPSGTLVSFSGSGFGGSEHDPTISSSPDGLISDAKITITYPAVGSVVSGTFVVAAGASGGYTVTVHTVGLDQSASAGFTAGACHVGPVGGVVMPVNKVAVFVPYLALFGVMAVVVVAVAPWKKREN